MTCTEIVIQDHSVLRRSLDILDAMVQKMEAGQRIEIADVMVILNFLRRFGDEYHQTMEENVLFPALQRGAPQDNALQAMLSDHAEERELVARIEESLRVRRGRDFVSNSHQLTSLLRSHFNKEDVVLRGLAERSLSKEQDKALEAEFSRKRTQAEAFANFSRLERKYTPHLLEIALAARPAQAQVQRAVHK